MKEQSMFDVPVVFCTFNRLECTKKVFERIREVRPAKLYLVSDGPRENVAGEEEKVNSVREYLNNHIDWKCQVYRNFAEKNMGCGKRMSSGISWAFEQEEKLIILEDDCLADISFFRYCRELLDIYEKNENIMLIGGYNPLGDLNKKESIIYTPFLEIWGWATWKRVWDKYDYDIPDWKEKGLTPYMKKIMTQEAARHYSEMFEAVYTHQLDTWDYQLQYLSFQNETLNIVPTKNMIKNIGFGADATHTKEAPAEIYNEVFEMEFPLCLPSQVISDKQFNRESLKAYGNTGVIKRIKRFLHLDPNKSLLRKRG